MDFNAFFKKKESDNNITLQPQPVRAVIPERIEIVREEVEDIIKLPRLELTCVSSKNERDSLKIIITPNSINGIVKKGDRFCFGRGNDASKNDYNFPEDTIGNKQFEIIFDKSKIL